MVTSPAASEAISGSRLNASAMLVNGPAAMIVTSPGWARTVRMMNSAAISARGFVVGSPSARWGTTFGG